MGAVIETYIEERQRLGLHRLTASGCRGSREERSLRVPLVGAWRRAPDRAMGFIVSGKRVRALDTLPLTLGDSVRFPVITRQTPEHLSTGGTAPPVCQFHDLEVASQCSRERGSLPPNPLRAWKAVLPILPVIVRKS